MNTIKITDTLKICHDAYGNYQPHVYDTGGELIKVGKRKGELSKASWRKIERYYPRLSMALNYCIDNGLIDPSLHLEGNLTLIEAIDKLELMDAKREEFSNFKIGGTE